MTDEVTSGIRVYPKHVRQARVCMGGSRVWMQRHGFDWNDFITNGIAVEDLEATGDKIVLDIAAIARAEHGRG